MIAIAMKVFKNLFGNDSKIHVDEIAVVSGLLLGSAVIVESGSNANGEYHRFGDGTQICWNFHRLSGYVSNRLRTSWYYPKAFKTVPAVFPSLGDINFLNLDGRDGPMLQMRNVYISSCTPHIWHSGIVDGDYVDIFLFAIGWWK